MARKKSERAGGKKKKKKRKKEKKRKLSPMRVSERSKGMKMGCCFLKNFTSFTSFVICLTSLYGDFSEVVLVIL